MADTDETKDATAIEGLAELAETTIPARRVVLELHAGLRRHPPPGSVEGRRCADRS